MNDLKFNLLKFKNYKLIIFVGFLTSFFFLLFSSNVLAYCSTPTDGTTNTISSDCSFEKEIDGVDGGGITVASSHTLTVGNGPYPNQIIVWAPGTSIDLTASGASIVINDGAQLKQGYIWYTDSDGDNYPTTDSPTISATSPGAGYKRRVNLTSYTSFDYNDSDSNVKPGTTCNGDCSINDDNGNCVAKAAGENGLPACQRCNGSSLTHVNIENNTQDTEGSNTCNATCKKCSAGSCVNQASGEDLFSQCSAVTCTDYIYGWSGNNCAKYSGSSANNGDCNGSGNCYTSVADSCSGVGATSASCGSAGCKKACVANAAATSYNTVGEVCYTADQHGCSGAYTCSGYTTRLKNICNTSGTCAAVDSAASDCSGTCASYCSSGSCISTDTSAGTCTVSTDARLASGGDGHCTSANCVGDCTANGGACGAGGDCCSGYCYADADGDGYGVTSGAVCQANASAGTDCCDTDANAHPGQTTYYSTARSGCGGYDYNCDGSETENSTNCRYYNCALGTADTKCSGNDQEKCLANQGTYTRYITCSESKHYTNCGESGVSVRCNGTSSRCPTYNCSSEYVYVGCLDLGRIYCDCH